MVTSDKLYVDRERQQRLQKQQQKQAEWRATHSHIAQDDTEPCIEYPDETTPVPSDCSEWMDTDSASGSYEWYEQHVLVDEASAKEIFDGTVDQSISDPCIEYPDETTPVPSDCSEWMDTDSASGNYEWYEQHVFVDEASAKEIFNGTVDQSMSPLWYRERAKRITASIAKEIFCRKLTTDPTRLLTRITSRQQIHSKALDYGRDHEKDAIHMYSQVMSCMGMTQPVSQSGFFISTKEPWLGASPDGIVGTGILEVKCPFTCSDCTFEAAAVAKRSFCLSKSPHGLALKKKHQYYHQVQVQLFVTKAAFCDFVVWSPSQLHIERIFPDSAFMHNIDVLRKFYFEHMLPFLVNKT